MFCVAGEMAGKSNKGRNKKVSHGSAVEAVPVKENTTAPELSDANGAPAVEVNSVNPEMKDAENLASTAQPKQGNYGFHDSYHPINISQRYNGTCPYICWIAYPYSLTRRHDVTLT